MKISGLPDILISRAKLEAQCERYGHTWHNQVGFGVFCRRCGAAPSNNGVQLTRRAGEIVDNESIAGGEQLTPDR